MGLGFQAKFIREESYGTHKEMSRLAIDCCLLSLFHGAQPLRLVLFGEFCLPTLTMVFPFVFMSGRGRQARGRGMGRGRGAQPRVGVTFDRDGPHAQQILRGYLASDPKYLSWEEFKKAFSATWIINATNPTGFYTLDNMRRNYRAVLKRYHDHIDPNNPFDGQFGFGVDCSCCLFKLLTLLSRLLLRGLQRRIS